MEPQLFSCGLKAISKTDEDIIAGFNGAATFQLRIDVAKQTGLKRNSLASMEPQLFSCGLYMMIAFHKLMP